MSWSSNVFDFFNQTLSFSNYHALNSNEVPDSQHVADFTLTNADKNKILIRNVKQGTVKSVKIYARDLNILTENILFLEKSLEVLRIRPTTSMIEYEYSDDEDTTQAWEKLSFQSECFIPHLERLSKLRNLYFDNNCFAAEGIVESVSKLNNLTNLSLLACGISSINFQLPCTLEILDLSLNKLSEFPEAILTLDKLRILTLSQNCIHKLPDEINKLKCLKRLDLSENKIQTLPDTIADLKSVMKLYLNFNEINVLPSAIGEMTNLRKLNLRNNRLTSLPESIGKLHQLIMLHLCNNMITVIPESICNMNIQDDSLLLSGNPLQMPPLEVCVNGIEAIKGFFEDIKKSDGAINSKRLKLVLLGESGAGKTSLANALVYCRDGNVGPDQSTVGLDYYNWIIPENDLQIRIVDCAGQRDYLLTHQFFFTEGALFVLVMDLFKYNMTDSDYRTMVGDWVNIVTSQNPGATILVVPTHLDLCEKENIDYVSRCNDLVKRLDAEEATQVKLLEKKMQSVKGEEERFDKMEHISYLLKTRPHFSRLVFASEQEYKKTLFGEQDISLIPVCTKGDLHGMPLLRMEIARLSGNEALCPIVSRKVPSNWKCLEEVVIDLRKSGAPFVKFESLQDIAESKCGLSEDTLHRALVYLNAIGSIEYFSNVKRACHLVFIDQKWFIELLKLLFRHNHENTLTYKQAFMLEFDVYEGAFHSQKVMFLTKGYLSKALLKCIWHPFHKKYVNFPFAQVVEILYYFGIICKLENEQSCGGETYFIPWFVPAEELKEAKEKWEQDEQSPAENIITCLETGAARLPVSIVCRLLVSVQSKSKLCIPWKSGFLIINENLKLRCKIVDGKYSSAVTLHGRCKQKYVNEIWKLMADIWKELDTLINEWNGVVLYELSSLCPYCVESNRSKPFVFRWMEQNGCAKQYTCHHCNKFVDSSLVFPQKDSETESNSSLRKTGPLEPQEMARVATMIGVAHTELAGYLGIDQIEIGVIQANWPRDVREQASKILAKWKEQSREANRSQLIAALEQFDEPNNELINFLKFG